jgi:RNA polymerase sigma factor (sigma-70 family)
LEPISLKDLKKGEASAWSAFFERYNPLIDSVTAWSKWRFSHHDRREVAQDVRAELGKTLANFRGESSLELFVKRVCIYRCIDRIRRQVRERRMFAAGTVIDQDGTPREVDHPAGEDFDPVAEIIRFERARVTRKMLDSLDATCQTAIRLFYLDSLSYKEIAGRLGIAVNTVGSRLAKCLEKLRSLIQKEDVLREYFIEGGDKASRSGA